VGIEIRHVSKSYGTTTALNDVSLVIEDGEFVTLLGPSGCGKTTLLRIVAGFLDPDAGDVLINGTSMKGIPPDSRPTGMVFQSYALFPHMTVEQNVSFGLRMRHLPAGDVKRRVSNLLELVGVQEMAKRYPAQLSGGQQQRVAVARTLAIEPAVLLLDEPLASLDRKLRIQMRTELKKLVERVRITSIFVTHDQEEALTISDRIAVMDHGNVMQYATPMQVYDTPCTPFVASFVGNSNLFHGAVRSNNSGSLVLEGEGFCLPLPAHFNDEVGREISILLRPEHLQVSVASDDTQDSDLAVSGTVSYVTLSGALIDYEVRLDSGQQLVVDVKRIRDQTPIARGSRVIVSPIGISSYLIVPAEERAERKG
jgi:spermidine/putrescine ABC transporter ATP-binding subunit